MAPDVPMVIVGLPMALALGLVFGMGPCLLSCLPYLGPVFLGAPSSVKQSWRVLLPLSLGRLTAYASLGGVSGWFGQQVADQASMPAVQISIGCATLMVGLALWRRARSTPCAAPRSTPNLMPEQPVHWVRKEVLLKHNPLNVPRTLMPGGLFLMGLGMALSPCAPLGMVLFSAALSARVLDGALLALCFGLGAITVPTLVYGIGVAYVSHRLREQLGRWLPRIERASALLLMLVGTRQLIAWWIQLN